MRRKDRGMQKEDAIRALEKGTWGVFSTADSGRPYGVPVNYLYSTDENAIFFHCATEGRKLDNIRKNKHVCFTVITDQKIVPERFTTLYKSIVASD